MRISHPNVRMLYFLQNKKDFRQGSSNSRGSLVDYERTRSPPQPCPQLLQNCTDCCYGSALFLRCLWSDITGEIADVHIRTDANNLVTTASTTHQPEQTETMHLIQMLRKESATVDRCMTLHMYGVKIAWQIRLPSIQLKQTSSSRPSSPAIS